MNWLWIAGFVVGFGCGLATGAWREHTRPPRYTEE
jgi:hypothetical protein